MNDLNKLCDRLFEEMEKSEEEARRKEREKLEQNACFQCIWSTLRETKLYCPYKGCMKE